METADKIPKVIHYVWVGDKEIPEHFRRCIDTFKTFHPDWEVKEWNEVGSNLADHDWVKLALAERNWALASDVIRVKVLKEHGGIYMDTDVEVLQPLDKFLENSFFIGYENKLWANTAIIGSVANHPIIVDAWKRYEVPIDKIKFNTNLMTVHNFNAVIKRLYGVKLDGRTRELPDNAKIYAKEYFYPQDYITYRIRRTENSHTIHHYASSWHTGFQKSGIRIGRVFRMIVGAWIWRLFERMARRGLARRLNKERKRNDRNSGIN